MQKEKDEIEWKFSWNKVPIVSQEKVWCVGNALQKNRRDLLNCDPVAESTIVNLIRRKIIAVLKYRSLLDPM